MSELRSFGGTSPSVIDAFERLNNVVLPADYKAFLIEHNGRHLTAMACTVKGLNQQVLVEVLLGIGQQQDFDLQWWCDEYSEEMPSGFVVIALGATGMYILGTGEPTGVYFWDDAHSFRTSSEEGNTYRVAATFTEFLGSLVPV